ncbi:MAG TPA: tetratricopeptide repeat protein [Flavitalea sp.]|nr:tetratricopeptide repeat protein [Flavitalea sp.]
MKKEQLFLLAGAALLFCAIYFLGKTTPPKKTTAATSLADSAYNIQKVLEASRSQLSGDQRSRLAQLENSVVRGNVREQKAEVFRQIASFYRDSAHLLLPYAYYTGEAAKLENSEKSLTFAARFFLENARKQDDEGLKKWMANESKQLFEKALVLDPGDDSLKVGLGSCYIFGNIADNPMQGVMMIREVAERDPSNMYAQFMLGVGGLMSGQLDRAIDRLTLVASKQPDNVELKLMLAEAYERKGDKQNAVKWYESVRSHIGNPEILQELDKRIQTLKN